MMIDKKTPQWKTWLEISRSAIAHNLGVIKSLTTEQTEVWSVVKSNAYGHGIFSFTKVINELGISGFCVDSVIEGIKLREQGIQRPILVLGSTLPTLYQKAAQYKITLSISTFENLEALTEQIESPIDRPEIHIKIDTGMLRQGFFPNDLKKVITVIKKENLKLKGIFSHFASAKDVAYPTFTEGQFRKFQEAIAQFEAAGFTNIKRHIAATGGTLLDQKYHLDVVRVGIGLYGIYPSKELEIQMPSLGLLPALSWRAVISEVKTGNKGEYIGYDLTERLTRKTEIAIVPIGYWHGYPWALSSNGTILVNGQRAKVLGRVSMDMIAIDVTGIGAKVGSIATIIGKDKKEEITAREVALKIGTSPYEIITRINPLIEHIITD
jgi:alanine racemase